MMLQVSSGGKMNDFIESQQQTHVKIFGNQGAVRGRKIEIVWYKV